MGTTLFPPQDGPGRPAEITEEKIQKICDVIGDGGTWGTAAARCGMNRWAVRSWIRRGFEAAEKDPSELGKVERLCMKLCEDLDKAKAEFEMRHVCNISKIAFGGEISSETTTIRKDGSESTTIKYTTGDWRASQFLLSMMNPDRYSQKSISKVEKEITEKRLNVDISGKLPEGQAAKLQELLQRALEGPVVEEENLAEAE